METVDQDFAAMLLPYLKYAGDGADLTPDAELRALGLDSMRAVELLFAVEDTYAVVIPDERLTDATFATVGSLWTVIEAELGTETRRSA
ncbi:phosphopantetheine-binding protein [Amycolatopsis alba]|uniref:Phosphopantetheine-binding protein n=1 Tax=Amycolatopsis alba DSM 44262 TaxID=1125972 RepID=A0A229RST7_AMYAL|nr:phosphopantetheine-binding protein [Amycolatopsis alba]OXM49730.1 phosphopantetheine-binding protein [Amycolatopsis alba DSM 44262]